MQEIGAQLINERFETGIKDDPDQHAQARDQEGMLVNSQCSE